MNVVLTEESVLRGEAVVGVERRDGTVVQVACKALSWAAACKVMSAEPGEAMVFAVLSGVDKEHANDAFLNTLTPAALSDIGGVVLKLTHGLPALKKAQAARNSAQQNLPISTPPPASCASTDSIVASVMDSAPRS
jgi:hypothetical protein